MLTMRSAALGFAHIPADAVFLLKFDFPPTFIIISYFLTPPPLHTIRPLVSFFVLPPKKPPVAKWRIHVRLHINTTRVLIPRSWAVVQWTPALGWVARQTRSTSSRRVLSARPAPHHNQRRPPNLGRREVLPF